MILFCMLLLYFKRLKVQSELKSTNITLTVKNEREAAVIKSVPHVRSLAEWYYVCVLLCLSAVWREEPIPREQSACGGVHHWGPSPLPCHWSPRNLHQFKTKCSFLPSLHTLKKTDREGTDWQSWWEITRLGPRMPAYATNMRLKFPIVALVLEIITIILFAVFVTYDDGKSHDHDSHTNETHKQEPMDLYPSKFPCWKMLQE